MADDHDGIWKVFRSAIAALVCPFPTWVAVDGAQVADAAASPA